MQLTASNAADIQKYYEGSWIKLRELGDRPLFVIKVTHSGVIFKDTTGTEGIIHLDDDHPYDLDMVLPNKAMFQYGNQCHSLSRIPARQYHRGITAQNCLIQALSKAGWSKVTLGGDRLAVYMQKPSYKTLDDATQSNHVSEALSSRFAYGCETRTVYCDNTPVATVNPPLYTIGCKKLFVSDVTRLLKPQSLYKVVAL